MIRLKLVVLLLPGMIWTGGILTSLEIRATTILVRPVQEPSLADSSPSQTETHPLKSDLPRGSQDDVDSLAGESAGDTAADRIDETAADRIEFKRDVFPILESRCFECHAGETPDSGLRLDLHRELLGYSAGEAWVVPGDSQSSRLIQIVGAESDEERMPPDGDDRLSEAEIEILTAWIDQGLNWDDELLPPLKLKSEHWAFQPIVPQSIPDVDQPQWVKTPVDAFIIKAQMDRGLTHSTKAPDRTLVRRLYLDLIGLPPTHEQMEAFLDDDTPQAYEDLVDQLLASPHYGERWARYWLDLARWAESQGYQHDAIRPYAWRYREYVIDSFNQDKPYDRFIKEQLAGDELQPYSDENLIATGFLAAARISGNEEDQKIQRNDVMVDMVNATGSVMLGLTMHCAQCHNHKFDPVSQRDYYRLQAFFTNGQLGNLSLREPGVEHPTDVKRWVSKSAYAFYAKELKKLIRQKKYVKIKKPHTWGYLSAATGDPGIERFSVVNRKPIKWNPESLMESESHMLLRGDVATPGPQVTAAWPEVLGGTPSSLGAKPRSALADWMASSKNPLVARVWVNRVWQYHFGAGIVATASDFGVEGATPTHPELLDWLAMDLIEHGWSTKRLHRQIVLSSTYRQQRGVDAANLAIDPENELLWQWPQRRLSAEAIRDSVLVATGELDRTVGGVSIPPEREEANLRRTVYLFQKRSSMPVSMNMFDAPNCIASCARRPVSTVALQPLYLLNSEFMAKRAGYLAGLVREAAGDDVQRQIEMAFDRTLSRRPSVAELELAGRLFQSDQSDGIEVRSLERLCLALFNLNEFVYIP